MELTNPPNQKEMKKYSLIVTGTQDMPIGIELDVRPIVGDYITINKVTSIVDKVSFDLDGNTTFIIAKLHVDNR